MTRSKSRIPTLSFLIGFLCFCTQLLWAQEDSFEPDNSAATARQLYANTPAQRSIFPAGDADWFTFTVSSDLVAIDLVTGGRETNGLYLYDTVMSLYKDDGGSLTEIGFNDDAFLNSWYSRIQAELGPGVYYVEVTEFGNNGVITEYDLTLTFQVITVPTDPDDPDDPTPPGPRYLADRFENDNLPGLSTRIRSGDEQSRSIHVTTDVDFALFYLTSNSTVTLETSGTDGDTMMWLLSHDTTFDPNTMTTDTSVLDSDDNGGASNFSKITTTLDPGTYYVAVAGKNQTQIEAYTLSLEIVGSSSDDDYEDNDAPLGAGTPAFTLDEGTRLSRVRGPGLELDRDVFAIEVTGDDLNIRARMDVLTPENDMNFRLTDAFGTVLQDATVGVKSEFISFRVPSAGTYYLEPYSDTPAGSEYDFFWNALTDLEVARGQIPNDFDGDGRSDICVYYPRGGNWFMYQSTAGFMTNRLGRPGVYPFTGDFDGDQKSDYGYYNAHQGKWFFQNSSIGLTAPTVDPDPNLVAVVGDFDGDGVSDYGSFNPFTASWILETTGSGELAFTFGFPGVVPMIGDIDGDGTDDVGVYYAPLAQWYFYASGGGFISFSFGDPRGEPLLADLDGDGYDDPGCYIASEGMWHFYQSLGGYTSFNFGFGGTQPVIGDYDGDGRDDIGCYYDIMGGWYLFLSTEGFLSYTFGFRGTEIVR